MRALTGSAARLLKRVRVVVFDFDGVFTDNRVLVSEDGREAVVCTRADGLGLQLLTRAGVDCIVLSTETNPVVSARCRKLGLPCVQGQWNKVEALERLLAERGVPAAEAAYVGNDVNDLGCLERAGVPIAVADAHPAVKAVARVVTTRKGGEGAVREICEWILAARGVDIARAFRQSVGVGEPPGPTARVQSHGSAVDEARRLRSGARSTAVSRSTSVTRRKRRPGRSRSKGRR